MFFFYKGWTFLESKLCLLIWESIWVDCIFYLVSEIHLPWNWVTILMIKSWTNCEQFTQLVISGAKCHISEVDFKFFDELYLVVQGPRSSFASSANVKPLSHILVLRPEKRRMGAYIYVLYTCIIWMYVLYICVMHI